MWICLGFLLYGYFGYPVGIWFWGRMRAPHRLFPAEGFTPDVTLIVSAHNEEKVIRDKLDNCRDLDYPPDRLRVIVVSDASTDRTDEFVRDRSGEGIDLFPLPERMGKVEGINRIVPECRAEIVVLSDANSMYRRDAVRKLVRHFADPEVGLVSGQLQLVNPMETGAGRGESLYWRYESGIRRLESRLGRVMGATGPIYAFRKKLFRAVPPNMFCDLMIPVRVALAGYRVVYDPEAVCVEESAQRVGPELRRRFRNSSRGFRTLLHLVPQTLTAGRGGILLQLLSHKLIRWVSMIFLIGVLTGTIFSDGVFFRWLLVPQGLFYGTALAGGLLDWAGVRRNPFLGSYFLLAAHTASLWGVMNGFLRPGKPYWTPRNA